MKFSYPLILCDIGGTNVRVAVVRAPKAEIELLGHLKTNLYAGLADAIEAALSGHRIRPRSVIACAAGPMKGRLLALTNADWTIDGPAIAETLDLAQGLLLNDFEAMALSLPALERDWLTPIGSVPASPGGPRLILGPGTGLGAAALVEIEGRFVALPSEAGHVGFGPSSEEEAALWPHLERAHGRITAECVVSGPGLLRLHRARLQAAGRAVPVIDGVTLVDRAIQDRTGEEARTVRLFWTQVGRFSGDLALIFLAGGGVTLGGGILPRILPLLDTAAFRAAFEAKAPVERLVEAIPTDVITAPDAVLTGMAAIAADPSRYGLDYNARAWR
ncbi:MAG TPA: glucokinase [Beijerinckiaceae bacterium]|nr:glucokinase [Beijerinckiaceae bacterium]